jgi:SAM-dependent methyltransferase
MAHQQQQDYLSSVRNKFTDRFKNCSVLDIGSLDINGNNQYLFEGDYTYVGVDIGPGPNVDVICKGHEYTSETQFDIVVSSECFEHDPFYKDTILNAIKLTKPGGIFTFTCATTGRAEHGTKRTGSGWASPHTTEQWDDYYKNLTEEDIREFLDVDNIFSDYEFQSNVTTSFDLYFYGIKK